MPEGRPFLIAGGTIDFECGPASPTPGLIPVEYTPLYTGVRQRFGTLGGTYVMPWAYDRAHAVVSGNRCWWTRPRAHVYARGHHRQQWGGAATTLILDKG